MKKYLVATMETWIDVSEGQLPADMSDINQWNTDINDALETLRGQGAATVAKVEYRTEEPDLHGMAYHEVELPIVTKLTLEFN